MKANVVAGAWTPAEPSKVTWYPLVVPRSWREQVDQLVQLCRRGSFKAPPLWELDAAAILSMPPGSIRFRRAWGREDRPWFAAPSRADLTALILTVRDWINLEFGELLPDLIGGVMASLRDDEWVWGEPVETWLGRSTVDREEIEHHLGLLSQWAAAKFLEHPHLVLGGVLPDMKEHHLSFVRQVTLDGAEVVSWPPVHIPVEESGENGEGDADSALASIVIRFTAQTVPGRATPLLFHHVSLRRYWSRPLVSDDGQLTSPGWKFPAVAVGMSGGALPSQSGAFTLVTLRWRPSPEGPVWPRALEQLLTVVQPLPTALDVCTQPLRNLGDPANSPFAVQTAVTYNTKMGEHSIANGGVSVSDLARVDGQLANHPTLRLSRAGQLRKLTQFTKRECLMCCAPLRPKKGQEGKLHGEEVSKKERRDLTLGKQTVPMHDPVMVVKTLERSTAGKLRRVLILFRSPDTYKHLESQLIRVLQLIKTDSPEWFEGPLGLIQVMGRRIDDALWNYLEVKWGPSAKQRRRTRADEIKRRVNAIRDAFPPAPSEGAAVALVEIPKRPDSSIPPEADPKLAWRIGLGQLGYVNQHIHPVGHNPAEAIRPVAAVAELWRHMGVIPAPIFHPRLASKTPTWLLTLFVLRRTRRTSATGRALKAIFVLRTHAPSGRVEVSTPSLLELGRWVTYREGLLELLTERWDRPEGEDYPKGSWEQRRQEEEMLLTLAVQAVQSTLAVREGDGELPRVLWLTEAHNVRNSFPFLSNKGINQGDLERRFLSRLPLSDRNRLAIVRLRTDAKAEVPSISLDDPIGGRPTGLYRWDVSNQEMEIPIYVSLAGLSSAFKFMLTNGLSRLDNGSRENRSSRPLEVAVLHAGTSSPDDIALVTHYLRSAYPYFEIDRTVGTKLPFPFQLAVLAGSQYAVDATDAPEADKNDDSSGEEPNA